MKKQRRNTRGREASKLKQMFLEQCVKGHMEKRRAELESDFYSDLMEWVSDYIFPELKTEELREKVEEFREFRERRYNVLLSERQELMCG